jgi:hypothetical protein
MKSSAIHLVIVQGQINLYLSTIRQEMILETQMGQGSRVRRHGKSRASPANHLSKAGTRFSPFCVFKFGKSP